MGLPIDGEGFWLVSPFGRTFNTIPQSPFGDRLDSQVSATHSFKKTSAGDLQPKTFLGRLLIRLTT